MPADFGPSVHDVITVTAADLDQSAPAGIRVRAPYPGQTVLGCRCGRALDLRDMHRLVPDRATAQTSTVIHKIVCQVCAAAAGCWA